MITFRQRGDFSRVTRYLVKIKDPALFSVLDRFGEMGVNALKASTPTESGETADAWSYRVEQDAKSIRLAFYNSNSNQGVPIAIILQYGHGTGTGGWVEGRDYINPALQPVFDALADQVWEEVTRA